jgi:hypothetical protein
MPALVCGHGPTRRDGDRMTNSFIGHVGFGRDGSGDLPSDFLPIRNGRGGVAFAGRLDDRRNITSALDLSPYHDHADIQLAARAVERWGVGAPGRLLGDFALAAWFGR